MWGGLRSSHRRVKVRDAAGGHGRQHAKVLLRKVLVDQSVQSQAQAQTQVEGGTRGAREVRGGRDGEGWRGGGGIRMRTLMVLLSTAPAAATCTRRPEREYEVQRVWWLYPGPYLGPSLGPYSTHLGLSLISN